MRGKKVVCVLLASCFSMNVFGKGNNIDLKIDYNGKQQCVYAIEYTSQANFKQKGAITKKTTGVNCMVTATLESPSKVIFKADTVAIKSDLYKDDQMNKVRENLKKSVYSLSILNGYPSIDTSAVLPAIEYVEWDLYRQLVKLLPSMPEKPVRPGYTWENHAIIPMQTARGRIPCELYRFYTFKKLKKDTATIVWNFRFGPAENTVDSTNAMESVPVGGKGSGTALIDITSRSIISADMGFTTPVATINGVSVDWKERAVFTLKGCK